MDEKKLQWLTVEPSELPAGVRKAYEAYQRANEVSKEAREAFEASFTAAMHKNKAVPVGKMPRYGYKWGKLAVAFDNAMATGKSNKPGKFSM